MYNHFILHFRYHVIMGIIKFVVVDSLSIFNMMYHNGMISTKIGITVCSPQSVATYQVLVVKPSAVK